MFFIFLAIKNKFKGFPFGAVFLCFIILFLGLYNLYSATSADLTPGKFHTQVFYISIGTILLFLIGLFIDLKEIERISFPSYLIVCLLLTLVDIFGHNAKGAERWLTLGFIRIQPSEFTKLVIILMIAKSLSQMKGVYEFSIFNLWKQIIIILIPFILILGQPDLGTASIIFFIAAFQLATLRIYLRSLIIITITAFSSVIIAWNFFLYDYQKLRVLTFLNPMLDPKGSGYHSLQSMIAVGSGRIWGQGYQQGTQAKLRFLPERHTDFVFSVWAEEHGFIGCITFIILYVFFLTFIFQIAEKAKDNFTALVCIGITAFFSLHFLINVSMVIGIFPVVGVPLTLMSYGGTHMITAMCCMGLLVAAERKRHSSAL